MMRNDEIRDIRGPKKTASNMLSGIDKFRHIRPVIKSYIEEGKRLLTLKIYIDGRIRK